MDLDRGTLARLDRRLLAGLGSDEQFQMVRVPVTPAKWSTWKRYCDTAGISMGRAIAALIDHELASVFGEPSAGAVSILEEQAHRRLADREAALTKRERELSAAEGRVHRLSEDLRRWEREIEVREWRVESATKMSTQPAQIRTKTGRNERCRCGSGLKYKHCHGLLGR
ncbi:MAG: SEC-C metal-binding domain-containing protein [Acidimicrobiia bacterium]